MINHLTACLRLLRGSGGRDPAGLLLLGGGLEPRGLSVLRAGPGRPEPGHPERPAGPERHQSPVPGHGGSSAGGTHLSVRSEPGGSRRDTAK